MLKTVNLFLLFILIVCSQAMAQSWQWGKRGGSGQLIGGGNWEKVHDMATDANGNVYLIGHVAEASVDMDGQVKQGNGNDEIAIASYSCSGQLRWWKIIGGTTDDGWNARICTDKQNGVYASLGIARVHGVGHVKIDTDTSFTGISYTSAFLIKYDTAGTYKWLHCPQADTVTAYSFANTGTIDMEADDNGNIYWMCHLPKGTYAKGQYVVNNMGEYVLKYDRNGAFQSGVQLDMKIQGMTANFTRMTRDHRSGKFYVAGKRLDVLTIGNTSITKPKFLAVFDANGTVLWKIQEGSSNSSDGFYGKPVLDADRNIYIGSSVQAPDTFLSYVADPTVVGTTPLIAKLDSVGNLIWAQSAVVNGATFGRGGVALRNSGEVVLHGQFPGKLSWPGYAGSFNVPPNTGHRPFIARFNTQTGKVLGMEELVSAGGTDDIVIRADGRNNVYIGGLFRASLTIAGTPMAVVGGESDWFAAKYGHNNCNCTNIPEPKFAIGANGQAVSFSYTGSAATSVKWYFGDGDSSIQSNPVHTYTGTGNYIVCVKALNDCGDNTYCANIHVFPTSVKDMGNMNGVRVYPNPASSLVTVDGLNIGATVKLTDMTGRLVRSGVANDTQTSIDIEALPKGMYILQLVDADGSRYAEKVVKE